MNLFQFLIRGIEFAQDFSSTYDFCLVFPTVHNSGCLTSKEAKIIIRIRELGFECFLYKSASNNLHLLIRAPLQVLRNFADHINYPLLLDPIELKDRCLHGNGPSIKGFEINDVPEISPISPYQYIYGAYSMDPDRIPERLYWRENSMTHPFRDSIRQKLTPLILRSRPKNGHQLVNIPRLLLEGSLLGFFPLHNHNHALSLYEKWALYPRKPLPVEGIKEYFGEKLGLYFVFMDHFFRYLSVPALLGLILQILVLVIPDLAKSLNPLYSFGIAIWAIVFLEYWKRREKEQAMQWGTVGFEVHEVDRAEFNGVDMRSFVDGSSILYFPSATRTKYIQQSIIAITLFILFVFSILAGIYFARYILSASLGSSFAQMVASGINVTQIIIMNFLYEKVARFLTDKENHRTDTEYEDSMIVKLFIFQFVNSFTSFFYIAFAGSLGNGCVAGGGPEGCMTVLAINLGLIFFANLCFLLSMRLIYPYLTKKLRQASLSKEVLNQMTRPELEFLREKRDASNTALFSYADAAITFGFTTLFVTALPISSTFALVTIVLCILSDGWSLLFIYQRPASMGAEDIGTWQSIFSIIATISVLSNAGLTVFTMDVLSSLTTTEKFWVFILFQWACLFAQNMISMLIPDCPEAISIQLQRSAFINRKVIDLVPDEHLDDWAEEGVMNEQELAHSVKLVLDPDKNPSPSPVRSESPSVWRWQEALRIQPFPRDWDLNGSDFPRSTNTEKQKIPNPPTLHSEAEDHLPKATPQGIDPLERVITPSSQSHCSPTSPLDPFSLLVRRASAPIAPEIPPTPVNTIEETHPSHNYSIPRTDFHQAFRSPSDGSQETEDNVMLFQFSASESIVDS